MPGNLFLLPRQTPLNVGVTIPGAKLHFFQSGTSTPQNTYTDLDLSTPHDNPVVADAGGGFAPIYLDPSLPAYRVRLTDASDVQLYQVDDVPSGTKTAADEFTISGDAPYIDLIESDASSNNGGWRIQAQSEKLTVYAMNDAKSVLTKVLEVDRTGTTVDLVNLTPTEVQINGEPIFASGSFTGALSGFSADLTPTIQWRRSMNTVWLSCNAGSTGTSTTTAMTLGTLPEAIRPTSSITVLVRLMDNTANGFGVAAVGTNGVITFGNTATGGAFTGSGTKGLPGGWALVYDLQ